ncbi:MAG: caspase family protein, partial [Symploca sp. SIO2B6]|nr:caspase family protein [Symploca sp. SIO2B6]
MHQLKRRHFFQLAGSTAASIGLSQSNLLGYIMRQGDRYGRILAQDTPRKLALLVGINEYDVNFNWRPLRGCVNDVRMQEELLVHRFGFNRNDIVTLTDADATRTNLIKTFEEHLIQQAKPGDVVVFHYSGHGSRVVDPNPLSHDPFNSTFVTIDSPLPNNFGHARVEVNDIMGQTLFLMMLALQTEQVTAVLDSCHSGGGKRGVLTVRSRDGADIFADVHPSAVELETQERLRSQLGLSWEDIRNLREQGIAKGVAIASARRDQLASDASFNGFYAGAFTYLMTQYLWQQTGNESVEATVSNISRITRTFAKDMSRIVQEPEFEENRPSALEDSPIYFIPRQTPSAEAVVLGQKANGNVDIWLGGLSPNSVETVNEAIFTAMDEAGNEQGQLQVISRDGLTAEAQILGSTRSTPRPGLLLQEEIAGVPEDLTLRIGLDPSLGSEMAIAQQALAMLPRLEVKQIETGEVDYLFGRMTADYQTQQSPLQPEIPLVGSIGLFRPGQDVLQGSFREPEESVTDAVNRLQSKFSVLLASRLLKILVNPSTSQVNVVASMRPVNTDGSVATGTALT